MKAIARLSLVETKDVEDLAVSYNAFLRAMDRKPVDRAAHANRAFWAGKLRDAQAKLHLFLMDQEVLNNIATRDYGYTWTEDQLRFEEPASEAAPTDGCTHEWAYTGTAYGGDDPSYSGEGRCYCIHCGADGDA